MGLTKNNLFSKEQIELADFAKALAHPARIAILQYLIEANQCVNSTLVQEIGLAQATISQHLKALKEIGLVQGTIEGVSVSYCINPEKFEELKQHLNSFFRDFENGQLSCCD